LVFNPRITTIACELHKPEGKGGTMEVPETSSFERIEAEAHKELPLHHVLLFFGLAFCPVWISAAVAVAAELSFSSLPDNFYGALILTVLCSTIVTIVVAIILDTKLTKQQPELAKNSGKFSSFRLGLGVVWVTLRGWGYRVPAVLLAMFFLVVKLTGGDRAELTDAALFWYAQGFFAYVIGLIFCFFGFCLWLGHRVQKQRAAG
jgi:hypothetical protein